MHALFFLETGVECGESWGDVETVETRQIKHRNAEVQLNQKGDVTLWQTPFACVGTTGSEVQYRVHTLAQG
jgi:hypothetical protein